MEILTHRDYHNFINFLPAIKNGVKEWQVVDLHLIADAAQRYTIRHIADIMLSTFREKNGKIYIGSDTGLFMLISSGTTPEALAKKVESSLPGGGRGRDDRRMFMRSHRIFMRVAFNFLLKISQLWS